MPKRQPSAPGTEARSDTFVEGAETTLTEARHVGGFEAPRSPSETEATDTHAAFEDNRPTEFFDAKRKKELTTSRNQVISGSTIKEMVDSRTHHLGRAITQLLKRARSDLKGARIDAQAKLQLRHDFEFDTRVGYHLSLIVFDDQGRRVEVTAEVDPDGKKVRRESMMARLLPI